MRHEQVLVLLLVVPALLLMGVLLFVSLSSTAPPAFSEVGRLFATVFCPETRAPSRVGVATDPETRAPKVVWCERFRSGTFACDRACLSALERAGSAG